MTIGKGTPWGRAGTLPEGSPIATDDWTLREIVISARAADRPIPTVGLLGGDLCKTVGGPGSTERLTSGGTILPIDLCRVSLDGEETWFCSHLVARGFLWFGAALVAMNAQWLGEWDVAPRAHPNDGLVDLTEGRIPLGDRREARRRVRTGSHIPHPGLLTSRGGHHRRRLERATDIWLDGRRLTRGVREIEITVEPDAFEIVI